MRPFAWLAVLCLALAAWLVPDPDPAAVGVQRIAALLEAEVAAASGPSAPSGPGGAVDVPAGASTPGVSWSIAGRLLDAVDPTTVAANRRRIALGGVRFTRPGAGTEDLTIHSRARRAVVAALRATARERGLELEIAGERTIVEGGLQVLFSLHDDRLSARVRGAGEEFGASIPAPPADRRAWLPALCAIALMLLWRRPLVALLAGLCLGAGLSIAHPALGAAAGDPTDVGRAPSAFLRLLLEQCSDERAWKPMVAVAALLAVWAVTARNGGLGGFTAWLTARIASPRRAQLAAWCLAAATPVAAPVKHIVLGTGLRTLAARARLSSEKFAWLLDSTAVAATGLCLFSPWTAQALGWVAGTTEGARPWLDTLPWRAFSLATLLFGLCVALSGRDFGAMLAAERRAREAQGTYAPGARRVFATPEPDPRTAHAPWRLAAPLCVFLLSAAAVALRDAGAFAGAFDPRSIPSWQLAASSLARPDTAMVSALAALFVALCLSAVGGAERGVPSALLRGVRAAVRPCLLLLGSFALAAISMRLGAPEVFAATLGDRIAPDVLPATAFLLGAGAAYALGSSWAALPLCVPLVAGLASWMGLDFAPGADVLQTVSLAAVLEGALAGSLIAPWSAASLSASIGSGADHADHLRTQTPYALFSAGATLVFAFLPAGLFGLGALPALALVLAVHAIVFLWLGRASERRPLSPA